MIFNLLMYLLMADLQQVQSWIQQQATVYSWQSIGRVERPISARSQVQDRYLDSVIATNTMDESQIVQDWSTNIIDNYTYKIVWNYPFNKNDGEINLFTWTYILNITSSRTITADDYNIEIKVYKNGSLINLALYEAVSPQRYISLRTNDIYNFKTWDIITVWLVFTSNDATMYSIDVTTKVELVKLS